MRDTRPAELRDGKLHCGWCGSEEVLYSEEVWSHYKIGVIFDCMVLVEPDGEGTTLYDSLTCMECCGGSTLPDELIVFKRADDPASDD